MNKKTRVFAVVAILVGTLPAFAQSPLADAARREAARRNAIRAASIPTYTNDDLSRLPARAVPIPPPLPATEVTTIGVAGSSAPVPAPAAGQPDPAPAGAAAPQDEKGWRDRITTARANLSRAEMFAESLDSRINALSTDLINRDDPAQRQQLFEQREKALAEQARVKAEIAGFTRQIADIEEEARRRGVPPGWLR